MFSQPDQFNSQYQQAVTWALVLHEPCFRGTVALPAWRGTESLAGLPRGGANLLLANRLDHLHQ